MSPLESYTYYLANCAVELEYLILNPNMSYLKVRTAEQQRLVDAVKNRTYVKKDFQDILLQTESLFYKDQLEKTKYLAEAKLYSRVELEPEAILSMFEIQ